MKKFKYLLLLFLLVPMIVKAEVIVENNSSEDKEIDGSVVVFDEDELTSNLTTKGIEFLAGINVNKNGNSDYSLIAGLNVNIEGDINNDGFILGGNVNINENANVNRDLVIFGDVVKINGKINRDVTILRATSVIINGEITGSLNIKSDNIEINDAKIGKLTYNEDADIDINNSNIGETVKSEAVYEEQNIITIIMNAMIGIVSMLVLFAVICLFVPQLFKRINEKNKEFDILKFFSLFGFGTLFLILIPAVSALLFNLIFTVPLAILLMILYIIALALSIIFTGYLLGYLIWKNLIKKEENLLLIGLIGVSIVSILTYLPYIGGILLFTSMMIGMGIVLQQIKKD